MIGAALPRISCVTVTRGRVARLQHAVRCYLRQTYPLKDLVVLSQGEDNAAVAEYLRTLGRPDVRLHTALPSLTLGAMRNAAVELASGDVVCQWDDDDLYHPDRLARQYAALRADSRRAASLYCDFLKYFEHSGELYWCDWSGEPLVTHRYLCGSVMFHKELFGAFPLFYPESGPQARVEEDLHVLDKLLTKGELGPVWAGWQYTYVYHGANTYGLAHHELTLNTSWGKKLLGRDELLERRGLLEATLGGFGLAGPVKVRSADGVAFTYHPPGRPGA